MSSFIKSVFSYCLLVWILHSRISVYKLHNIHDKCLQMTTNQKSKNNWNHLLNFQFIKPASIRSLKVLSPELRTDIFTFWGNPDHICNDPLFGSGNPRSVIF